MEYLFGWVLGLAIVLAVVFLLFFLITRITRALTRPTLRTTQEYGLEALKTRRMRGEITEAEFEEGRRVIGLG